MLKSKQTQKNKKWKQWWGVKETQVPSKRASKAKVGIIEQQSK